MKKLNAVAAVSAIVLVLALGSIGPVHAHGDEHAAPRQLQPVSDEQHTFGRQGDPKKAARTIKVDMKDTMRFLPAELTIRQGETVRFVVSNSGKAMHEMVLGTMQQLKEHGELMKQHPGMEHDEPYMVHVAPGKKQEMAWQFTNAGEFHFGCLVPGHFEAGMIGKIKVIKSQ